MYRIVQLVPRFLALEINVLGNYETELDFYQATDLLECILLWCWKAKNVLTTHSAICGLDGELAVDTFSQITRNRTHARR